MLVDFLRQLELQIRQNKAIKIDMTDVGYMTTCSHDSPIKYMRVLSGDGRVLTADASIIKIWNVDREMCMETIQAPPAKPPQPPQHLSSATTSNVSDVYVSIFDAPNGNIVVVYSRSYTFKGEIYRDGKYESYDATIYQQCVRIISGDAGKIIYDSGYLACGGVNYRWNSPVCFSPGIYMVDDYREGYDPNTRSRLPAQGALFLSFEGKILAQIGSNAYGEYGKHEFVGFCYNGSPVYFLSGDNSYRSNAFKAVVVADKVIVSHKEPGYCDVKYLSDGSMLVIGSLCQTVKDSSGQYCHLEYRHTPYGSYAGQAQIVESYDKMILLNQDNKIIAGYETPTSRYNWLINDGYHVPFLSTSEQKVAVVNRQIVIVSYLRLPEIIKLANGYVAFISQHLESCSSNADGYGHIIGITIKKCSNITIFDCEGKKIHEEKKEDVKNEEVYIQNFRYAKPDTTNIKADNTCHDMLAAFCKQHNILTEMQTVTEVPKPPSLWVKDATPLPAVGLSDLLPLPGGYKIKAVGNSLFVYDTTVQLRMQYVDIIFLINALENNTSVATCNLTNLALGDKGAEVIAAMLIKNQYLKVLILNNTQITNSGAKVLLAAIQRNKALTSIELSGNSISEHFITQINWHIARNMRCAQEEIAAAKCSKAAEASRTAEKTFDIPPECRCLVTRLVMVDPVITADGETYEREAIQKWLEDHDTSPATNSKLEHKGLTVNKTAKRSIVTLHEKYPDLLTSGEVYFTNAIQRQCLIAIHDNNCEALERLLELDRRLLTHEFSDEITQNKRTLLFLVVRDGNYKLLDTLLRLFGHERFGEQIIANNQGVKLFEEAVRQYKIDNAERIAKELGWNCADYLTQMFVAIANHDAVMLTACLDLGVPLDTVNAEGRTPLHAAIDDKNLFELLVQRGANARALNISGITVLKYAENLGKEQIVQMIREMKKASLVQSYKEEVARLTKELEELRLASCKEVPVAHTKGTMAVPIFMPTSAPELSYSSAGHKLLDCLVAQGNVEKIREILCQKSGDPQALSLVHLKDAFTDEEVLTVKGIVLDLQQLAQSVDFYLECFEHNPSYRKYLKRLNRGITQLLASWKDGSILNKEVSIQLDHAALVTLTTLSRRTALGYEAQRMVSDQVELSQIQNIQKFHEKVVETIWRDWKQNEEATNPLAAMLKKLVQEQLVVYFKQHLSTPDKFTISAVAKLKSVLCEQLMKDDAKLNLKLKELIGEEYQKISTKRDKVIYNPQPIIEEAINAILIKWGSNSLSQEIVEILNEIIGQLLPAFEIIGELHSNIDMEAARQLLELYRAHSNSPILEKKCAEKISDLISAIATDEQLERSLHMVLAAWKSGKLVDTNLDYAITALWCEKQELINTALQAHIKSYDASAVSIAELVTKQRDTLFNQVTEEIADSKRQCPQ